MRKELNKVEIKKKVIISPYLVRSGVEGVKKKF